MTGAQSARVVEFVLAVLVTQMDVFQRLLGTAQLNLARRSQAGRPPVTA